MFVYIQPQNEQNRQVEWLEHFGRYMAKLPADTHCCGNCASHRPPWLERIQFPSIVWGAVSCMKHRRLKAEDLPACPDWEEMEDVRAEERQKLVEWLEAYCTEHWNKPFMGNVERYDCPYCMQALRKEVKDAHD